jgi:hypothetical protein
VAALAGPGGNPGTDVKPSIKPPFLYPLAAPARRIAAAIQRQAAPLPVRTAVQAKFARSQPKYYPNLNPAAAVPVDPDEIFRVDAFFEHYRLHRGRQTYVPNMKYIFVRKTNGAVLAHPRFRHPALAQGEPVLYAGEMYFDNGRLEWWSNGSGNYRPDAGNADQADLPMDLFFPFEDILRGKHKQPGRL